MLDLQWNLEDAKQAWRDEGFEQGIKQGIGQGKIAQAEQSALKMIHKNLPLKQIADFTDLPISRIQQLAKDFYQ